ncbi:MAG: fatty acid desaturase [Bdellovibrionales bacterium]
MTVTNHPILEFLHMNFGYHTEHHLMPKMCMSKAKVLHKALKEKFPNDYKYMSKREALVRLYNTPRIYKNRTTLVDPYTGEEVPTY